MVEVDGIWKTVLDVVDLLGLHIYLSALDTPALGIFQLCYCSLKHLPLNPTWLEFGCRVETQKGLISDSRAGEEVGRIQGAAH